MQKYRALSDRMIVSAQTERRPRGVFCRLQEEKKS
nr:MAG TPA: hypothetical protein [Caudoviricetes sp.]